MEEAIQLFIQKTPVRFTPEGKVYIVDAIRAVSESTKPRELWEQMKKESPELLSCISECKSEDTHFVQVADSNCWEKIQDVLMDQLLLEKNTAGMEF